MSITKRNRDENNQRRRGALRKVETADWAIADASLLRQAIATIAKAGGAIRFGYTRDGGAYAIGILGDGDPYTDYLRPTDNLDAYLEGLISDWGDVP